MPRMYGWKATNPQKTQETENYNIKPSFTFELKDVPQDVADILYNTNVDLTPVQVPDEIGGPVLHPTHYNQGSIEVWDFIADQDLNFFRGTVVRYICRAGRKVKELELEDLKTARAYLQREIERLEDGE